MRKDRKIAVTSGDLNAFYTRSIADQQITYVIELNGILDRERLESGLLKILEKVPVLHTVLTVDGLRIKRKYLSDYRCNIKFVDSPEDIQEEILRFISAPCFPENDLPLKLLVVRKNTCDTLCVKIDHTASDASGLKNIVYLLSDVYSTGEITLPVNLDRGMWQVFRKVSVYRIICEALRFKMPSSIQFILKGPFSRDGAFVARVALGPEWYKSLHDLAQTLNMTINDILLTAVYRTVFKYLPENEEEYPILVPVDMRRYLEPNKRCLISNCSGALYMTLSNIADESFSNTLKRVKCRMNEFKNCAPGIGAAATIAAGALLGGKKLKMVYDSAAKYESGSINLTNFGVVDESLLHFDDIQAKQVYAVGPVQKAPGLVITVSTFRNTLNFTLQGNDKQKVKPFVTGFFEGIQAELIDFVKKH